MGTAQEMAAQETVAENDNARNIREDLAAVHRIICLERLHEGTWTHLTALAADGEGVLVTPRDTYFSEVTASSLLLYDRQGRLVAGDGRPNADAIPIHWPVYDARPDVRCILHLHSPHATALTLMSDGRLDTRASQAAARFHGKIGYLDQYAVPRTSEEEGEMMTAALADKNVLLMKNHGVLVAAGSVCEAIVFAYLLERAAQLQVLAAAAGEAFARMSESDAAFLAAEPCAAEPGYLDGMKAMLDNRYADYKS